MRTERRRAHVVATALAAGVLATFGTVATSGTAQAEPYNCSADSRRDVASAICSGGSGLYRVVAECHREGTRYGPEVRPGTPSIVRCPGGAYVTSADVQITEW